MLMTVNIKLSIIIIAEIIPSTDATCLLQSISPQNGPSKVNCTWTGGIPNSTPANHQFIYIAHDSCMSNVSATSGPGCRSMFAHASATGVTSGG